MVLILNSKTGTVKIFSIKSLSCPIMVHETNKNYDSFNERKEKRLVIFRQRAMLKLDIFTGEPASEKTE